MIIKIGANLKVPMRAGGRIVSTPLFALIVFQAGGFTLHSLEITQTYIKLIHPDMGRKPNLMGTLEV